MKSLRTLFSLITILILIEIVSVINGRVSHKQLAYFYDHKTNRTLKPPIVSYDEENELKDLNRGFGRRCDCKQTARANVCSCCAGLKLPRIKFQREMCTRFQYNLNERTQVLMDVTMNGNSVGSQTFNCRCRAWTWQMKKCDIEYSLHYLFQTGHQKFNRFVCHFRFRGFRFALISAPRYLTSTLWDRTLTSAWIGAPELKWHH